jgi:hypothetical protein
MIMLKLMCNTGVAVWKWLFVQLIKYLPSHFVMPFQKFSDLVKRLSSPPCQRMTRKEITYYLWNESSQKDHTKNVILEQAVINSIFSK